MLKGGAGRPTALKHDLGLFMLCAEKCFDTKRRVDDVVSASITAMTSDTVGPARDGP